MGYEHTQDGRWHWLLFAFASGSLVGAWTLRNEPAGHYTCLAIALLMIAIGLGFMQLTVRDEQDALAVRFGPLPLFFTRVPYDKIKEVSTDRTNILDGWGIHYLPGRGTTYNIWGFDCVRIKLDTRTIRIGTDDGDSLVDFLREKVRSAATGESEEDQE
jgi:hypothetical protein